MNCKLEIEYSKFFSNDIKLILFKDKWKFHVIKNLNLYNHNHFFMEKVMAIQIFEDYKQKRAISLKLKLKYKNTGKSREIKS